MSSTLRIILAVSAIAILVIIAGSYLTKYSSSNKVGIVKNTPRSSPQAPSKSTPNTANQQASSSGINTPNGVVHTVNITSSGFAPNNLTIKKEEIVRWANSDSTAHNISSSIEVSDPRIEYKALNLGDIAAGSSKALKFSIEGTFGYVDKLHPNLTGTIVVK